MPCCMGIAYSSLEQYTDALAVCKKAIAVKPTGKDADLVRKRISEIEKTNKP